MLDKEGEFKKEKKGKQQKKEGKHDLIIARYQGQDMDANAQNQVYYLLQTGSDGWVVPGYPWFPFHPTETRLVQTNS
jgi:hypothetical protein